MRVLRRPLAAAVAVLVMGGAALAADPISIPMATDAEVPLYDNAGFDWSGFYAGIYGIGQVSPVNGSQYGLGVNLGVSAQLDYFLVGGEVTLHGLTDGAVDTIYGQVLGRGGVVITDEVLLYAAAGYGSELGGPMESDLLLGGGVEFALNDDISLRAQYLHGFAISGANPKDQITLGAQFHF